MIRLHHVPFSRSFRVLWVLQEMGLDFEVVEYQIRDGSLRTPEFARISPATRVPGLEIDGQSLFESGAIIQYLCETRPDHGFGRDVGDPERIRYLECLGFAETMASIAEQLNINHIFLRDPSMASPTVIKLNTARLAGTLKALDGMLEGQDYLLPSGFSAADMMMGFNIFAAPYYVKFDPYPRLQAYCARLKQRPGYIAARARDGKQEFYTKSFYPVPAA
ncbi:MAG: glutathione S-transferase family protein [Paracoccaceae bacterium]